jgi:hypothetical protein
MTNDDALDNLVAYDGEIIVVAGGYWVGIRARRVLPTPSRPHGIDYSLCLFDLGNERVICFDNAHPAKIGSGPARRRTEANDHVHRRGRIEPYAYVDVQTLLVDFWSAVDAELKKESGT